MRPSNVTVKIWDSENQEEEDAKSVEVQTWGESISPENISLRYAVEAFMDKRWSDNDYVSPMYINVRTPEGALLRFEVSALETVNFRAAPKAT